MSSAELEDRFQAVRDFAVRAGRGTLRYFQSSTLQVDRKSDESPVTVADREAEQQLRGWIAERFPQDGVLGEEFPETPGTSGYRWIVDPIDGTTLTAKGMNNAIAVMAVAPKGTMYDPSAVFYMEKLVTGAAAADVVDIRLPVGENIRLVAKAKGEKNEDVTVVILDRPRHQDMVEEIRKTGARIKFITDGDVQANIVIRGILKNSMVSGADADALTDLKARTDTVLGTFTF